MTRTCTRHRWFFQGTETFQATYGAILMAVDACERCGKQRRSLVMA